MTRGGIKIERYDNSETEAKSMDNRIPDWMSHLVSKAKEIVDADENRQKTAVTVVDQARERNDSIYEQMYAIMNGKKPLYSSVEEAVLDYQKKTGLQDHINNIQAESKQALAKRILQASFDEEVSEGIDFDIQSFNDGEGYIVHTSIPIDIEHAKSIFKSKHGDNFGGKFQDMQDIYPVEKDKGPEDLSSIWVFDIKKGPDINFAKDEGQSEKKNSESEVIIFTKLPVVKTFVQDLVRNNPHISIPAVQQIVGEVFESDGASSADIDDPAFAAYINELLKSSTVFKKDESSAIGRNYGSDLRDEHQADAFEILRPNKSHY